MEKGLKNDKESEMINININNKIGNNENSKNGENDRLEKNSKDLQKSKDTEKDESPDSANPSQKLLMFEAKPVSVFKLYYSLSSNLDIFLMIIGTIGSLGAGVAMPLFSIIFGNTLSGYGAEQNATPSVDAFNESIGSMVRNFLIVGAAMFVAYFLMQSLWAIVGFRQMHRLKQLYFQVILKQEQGWFDSNNAFEFSTKVQAQIKQVESGVGEKMGNILMMFSQVITGLIISFTTSWKLTLVLLSTSPLIVLSVAIMAKAMKTGMIDSRKSYEKAGGIAEEVLYNIKTVASFANFDFEIKKFKTHVDECKDIGIKNGLKLGGGMGLMWFFMFSTYCIAIIYGSILIVDKSWNSNANRNFLAGDVMTVIFSTVMAVTSLGGLGPNAKAVSEACIAASDFFNLQKREPKMDTSSSTLRPEKKNLRGKIEVRNLTFAYPSRPELKILKNMNLTFEPGQKVALVGESGSGKSTIVNLLERLYDWNEGSISIDGINIREFQVNYLRSLIGYVQQEPVLFNESIKKNIVFGRDIKALTEDNECNKDIDALIKEACEDAYANEFIDKIDGKYEYMVGIKGSKLSGGQKQRIAIARAILNKPKILLLDEATSALDNKSEKEVQRALDQISQKNVTTIIIAHRLSTVKNADKIYAIKNGTVLEEGTHQELLNLNGYYAGMVKSQMFEEDLKMKLGHEIPVNDEITNVQYTEQEFLINKAPSKLSIKDVESQKIQNNNLDTKNKDDAQPEISRMKLLSLLSDNKGNLFWATLGSALNGAIFPVYGLILATAINILSDSDMVKVKEDGLFIGLMFLIIAFGAGLGTFFQNYKFSQIGEVLTEKLRNLIFAKYLRLHLGYFDKNENSPGALLTKLSIDTASLNGLVLTVVGVVVQSLVTFLLGVAFSLAYDWRLALICLGFFPFIIISAYMQQKVRRGFASEENKLDVEAGSILSECVINTKTIFSYNFQEKAIDMYLDILSETMKNVNKQSMTAGVLFGIGQFSLFASYATVFYCGGQFILAGTLTFDNMTKSIMSILFSAFGVGIAQQYAGDFAKARNAFQSLFSTLDLASEIETTEEANKNKTPASENFKGKIEFRNVTFSYPTRPGTNVLKKLNFTILPGQSVAFVGYSGSGKSTIIQLVERFYDVKEGDVFIDDVNIKDYNLLELRKKIGLVSQEPCLFKRSVKENIRYGDLTKSDEDVKIAAGKANIMKFFTSEDDGTKDTPVSGGEKQRIAIARAFLKNPKILLLDEATSALDKDSENEVQKALNVLQGGRTSITIAHRLSTIENCDVIYVLEGGVIAESGTHNELYEKKGKYYTLYKYSSQP